MTKPSVRAASGVALCVGLGAGAGEPAALRDDVLLANRLVAEEALQNLVRA